MKAITELQAAFRNGSLPRDDYWRAMQQSFNVLHQLQGLLIDGEAAGVEIRADELHVITHEGLRMVWHTEDVRSAPNIIMTQSQYEPADAPFLLAAARHSNVILDVGANAGYYALRFAHQGGPNCRVHAFEPVPSTFLRLSRNIEINQMTDRIVAHPFGFSRDSRSATIYLPAFSGNSAASLRDLHPSERSEKIEVPLRRLDDFCKELQPERIDLIKIDVEGAELSVLQGGLQALRTYRPVIFMELLRKWAKPFGYHPNDVIALLGAEGYRCWTVEAGRLTPFERMDDDTVQTNFFFARPEARLECLQPDGAHCS